MYRIRLSNIFSKCEQLKTLHVDYRSIYQSNQIVYGNDVALAKRNGDPIVALESTIITHGMPYPDNLNTALRVEEIIREQGAIPATIGILNGKIHVGTDPEGLHKLATASVDKGTIKCSRRDFPFVISQRLNGGTTVSGTMLVANLAGISIMATGGIGGVHRGAESTFDVSADLMELSRTPVAVICAGVKAILDIPKTLEYLETQGVPVVTIGNSNVFPAFYCRETVDKTRAPTNVPNSKEASRLIMAQRELGLATGMLLAVPIPEEFSLNSEEVEEAIQEALKKAKCNNITGKEATPFLLQELNELTAGHSLRANKALMENNARMAAEIAREISTRKNSSLNSTESTNATTSRKNPVVIGGAISDTVLLVEDPEIKLNGGTHRGRSTKSFGGVGRNIAAALVNLGVEGTKLLSVVGNDDAGRAMIESLRGAGDTIHVLDDGYTARYTAVLDSKGECCFGIGEMTIFDAINPALVRKWQSTLRRAGLVVLDGNTSLETIRAAVDFAAGLGIPVWYEPTDIRKATKVFEAGGSWREVLHFISPNEKELLAIGKYFGIFTYETEFQLDLGDVKEIAEQLVENIPVVMTTLGSRGVLVARRASREDLFYDEEGRLVENGMIQSRIYPPLDVIGKQSNEIISVSGCGDCLAAGIICGIVRGLDEASCVSLALKAASLSLKSTHPVPPSLSSLRATCDREESSLQQRS